MWLGMNSFICLLKEYKKTLLPPPNFTPILDVFIILPKWKKN